jgi:XTP/dITP diphosphohydrolase
MFLLDQMEGVKDRSARFVTVIALVLGGQVYTFEGIVDGNISEVCRGSGGFGYDPVFVPEGFDVTFAEMSDVQKNAISHRAKALRALQVFLEA